MKKVVEFLSANPVQYLAAVGRDGKAKCRPFMFCFEQDGKLYLSDADKKNVFDVERYMKRRPAIVKPDEPFDMYELNASDLEPDNNNSTKRKEK